MNGKRARFHTMTSAPPPRVSMATAVMVVMGMVLLGLSLVTTADAAPIKTTASISSRVQAQTDLCEIGGGEIEVSYGYKNGKLTSAQTVCNGGSDDGWVCSNTTTTTDCYKRPGLIRPTESVVPGQRPDTAAPVENPQQTLPVVDDIAVPPGDVAEDPTGDDQARIVDPAEVCRALGGTPNVIEQGSTVPDEIRCTGGALDGMICYGTICDYFAAGPAGPGEDAQVPPTGGIELVQVESMAELEDAVRGAAAGVAEDPTSADTVVVYSQSGSTMTDNATNQVLACEALGGTASVEQEQTVGRGLTWVFVGCSGGLLEGLFCGNSPGFTVCWIGRSVVPEDSRVTPAAGVEVPAESVATEVPLAPSEPTAVPTDVAVEPTAVAEDPPVGPPPPLRDDNSVPPGGPAEDPTQIEPTPTEVVLQ